MIEARKNDDGTYSLSDATTNRHSETYARRDQIKRLGGRWDAGVKQWKVPARAVDELGATRIYAVIRAAFCHTPEEFAFANDGEVKAGRMAGAFCSRCDSYSNDHPQIMEVLGEGEEGMRAYRARA